MRSTSINKSILLFLILNIIAINIVTAVVQNIKIGAIFHEGEEELERAFDQALRDLEDEPNSFFNLKPVKKTGVTLESFRSALAACELLEEGVAAIFGPRPQLTRNVVSSIAGRFNVPHLEYSYRHRDDQPAPSSTSSLENNEQPEIIISTGKKYHRHHRRRSSSSINLYPSSRQLERAIAETIKHMNWHGYTYVYQTDEALARAQKALENRDRPNYSISLRELRPLAEIKTLESKFERDNVYESFVKEAMVQNSIVLDVENDNLAKVLSTINHMGFMSDYFMCLITGLDSTSVDIGNFISKDSVANITQFRFIEDVDWSYSVEAALLYDAVFAFNEALTNLFKNVSSLDTDITIQPKPLSCNGDAKYDMGPNITASILRKTKYGRKTGLMNFDEYGERNFELEIIKNQAGQSMKVGNWRADTGLIFDSNNELMMNASFTEAIKNKIFKVMTRVGPPYVMRTEDKVSGRQIGNEWFEGYCIDLIAKIEEVKQIKCEFELVPDGKYGSLNPKTKQWDGLIKQLLEFKADMAICDLSITSERQSAVDFTAPFMNLGISILARKADQVEPELFSFMSPLSPEVWMYMATAYLAVSLMIFFQARIAPGEWINPHPCNPDPEELENSFTLMNSMWFTMGSLMQQGCDILPRTPSIRVIAGMWWFFVLIMVSSYTANLAAFLTAVKMEESINDVEDLAKQTKIAYGALMGGSTYSFFKNSNTTLYQKIFNTMADAKPSVFTKTNDEGVDRVIKGKRQYAFFMESVTIDYQIERHCELQQVGSLLDNKGYGIAMPPNSPYRTLISSAILHLQEKGELQQLKQKWWKEKGGGRCNQEVDENSNELGMSNVGGVFLILVINCFISAFIGLGEFLWNIRKLSITEKITPWEAIVAELKFVVQFSAKTKPVRITRSNSKSTSFQGNDNSMHDSSVNSLQRMNSRDTANIINLNDNL